MRWLALIIALALALAMAGALTGAVTFLSWLPGWIAWPVGLLSVAVAANELAGKPVPFLRWSFLRMMFGMKTLLTEWQVGDGREERVAERVFRTARHGDADDVIRVIDKFGYQESLLINVGDRKGAIVDAALDRCQPRTILELGTYVGYSAIRMARKLPQGGHLYSIEFNEANAEIAGRIIDHAGFGDRISVVHGTLGDGGKTIAHLETAAGFSAGSVDFVFIDHAKDAYLPDLMLILQRHWLHPGSIVVADNVKVPGAPEYHAYMKAQEGKLWRTEAHKSYVEYQSVIADLMLVSEYLGS